MIGTFVIKALKSLRLVIWGEKPSTKHSKGFCLQGSLLESIKREHMATSPLLSFPKGAQAIFPIFLLKSPLQGKIAWAPTLKKALKRTKKKPPHEKAPCLLEDTLEILPRRVR